MGSIQELAIWIGVLTLVLMGAVTAIWYMRRLLLGHDDDGDDEDSLYTTAHVESLKSEGLINDEQYERLKAEVAQAARRRAARKPSPRDKKTGLFG